MFSYSFLILFLLSGASCNWEGWWTYDGISGPNYWGVINPSWWLCTHGKLQSPIDIDPKSLVFDPNLEPVSVDKKPVPSGILENTGQSLVFRLNSGGGGGSYGPQIGMKKHDSGGSRRRVLPHVGSGGDPPVNISGGTLAYRYQLESVYVHWGPTSDGDNSPPPAGGGLDVRAAAGGGSEHSVGGRFYPAEVQLMGFNADLFANLSEALGKPHGVVGVAVMVQEEARKVNTALRTLIQHLRKVRYRGQSTHLKSLAVSELLPSTEGFMTYEGSMTRPGCQEGVTWFIMNRPIYLGELEMASLRSLRQGEPLQPKSPLGKPNARPLQGANGRLVRTNVAVAPKEETEGQEVSSKRRKRCPDVAEGRMTYTANNGWGED